MSWNHRVIKKELETDESRYGIHEVFYNDTDQVIGMTVNSLVPVCGSLEDLSHEMTLMFEVFRKDILKFEAP